MDCCGCGAKVFCVGGLSETGQLFCDECGADRVVRECRICAACGKPMTEGMTDLAEFYAHEGECFKTEMNRRYPAGWRETADEGSVGGYYASWDNVRRCYRDTGIFYTEWGS